MMLAVDEDYTFGKDVVPGVGLTNFSPPEDGFVWSTGSWCQVTFPYKARSAAGRAKAAEAMVDIALDIDVFKAVPDLPGQDIFIYVNGARLASRFITHRLTVMLEVPGSAMSATENVIVIDTPDAARPAEHGGSDTRRLGVQLFSIKVTGD